MIALQSAFIMHCTISHVTGISWLAHMFTKTNMGEGEELIN